MARIKLSIQHLQGLTNRSELHLPDKRSLSLKTASSLYGKQLYSDIVTPVAELVFKWPLYFIPMNTEALQRKIPKPVLHTSQEQVFTPTISKLKSTSYVCVGHLPELLKNRLHSRGPNQTSPEGRTVEHASLLLTPFNHLSLLCSDTNLHIYKSQIQSLYTLNSKPCKMERAGLPEVTSTLEVTCFKLDHCFKMDCRGSPKTCPELMQLSWFSMFLIRSNPEYALRCSILIKRDAAS